MIRRAAKAVAFEIWLPAVVFIVLWSVSARSTNYYYPPLTTILRTFREMWLFDRAWSDGYPSVRNFILGLAMAIVIGIAAGLLLGLNGVLYQITLPVLEFMRAIPGIVLVPVGLALIGIGDGMKITVIAYGTLWPVMLGTVDGVRSIDPLVRDMAKSFRLGRLQYLRRVVLPAASPQILAGARISVSLGVVLIIASEYVASTHGIGYVQLQSERTFAVPEMWASLILLGLLGYASNLAFRVVEHRLLRWYIGLRSTDQGGPAS
jgi:ABC-type nitrate/sulfonate/bicarbonate transport system permease component